MNKKKLTKKIWHGSEVNASGQPIIPPLAKDSNDLEGLHEGELFLHNSDEMPSIWVRTKSGLIKSVTGSGNIPSFWELKTTDNGFNYLYTKLPIVTQYGVTMYKGESINLPSIYDGLPIDHDTIYWENGVLKAKGGGGTGGVDEGAVRTLIESYDYATKDFVRDYVLENATGGEFELSKKMVIDALGFTPYSAENPNGYITAASIPLALKNPYALTFGSKTYDGSAAKSITASDLGAALSSDLSKYLPLSGGTINGKLTITHSDFDDVLTIRRITADGNAVIKYANSSEALGHIGMCGPAGLYPYEPYFRDKNGNGYKMWHGGNLTKLSQLTDDVVSGKYLPLSGGTMTGNITMGTNKYLYGVQEGSGALIFFDGKRTVVGSVGASTTEGTHVRSKTGHLTVGTTTSSGHTVWDSGNDGSGSELDADLLDGKHLNDILASNVASATKLQTARTIWGQSFDGSADVTGPLKLPNDNTLRWLNNAGADINCIYLSNENKFFIGNGVAEKGYDTYLSGKNLIFRYGPSRTVGAILNSSGNLTVGATDLAGTDSKLYVNGTAIIGNNVAGGELLKFNMERPWTFIQEASGSDSKLVLKPMQNSKHFIVKNANNEKLLLCLALNGGNIIEIGGTLRLDNNKNLQAKDTSGAYINLLGLNSSNQLSIGYGLNSKGYVMGLGGKIVNFYYGTERTLGMVLNENGNLVPSTSNTYALGAYNNNWSYIYTTGIRRWDGSTANEAPLLHGESNNTDITLLRVSYASSSYFAQTGAYGFTLKYFGTGGGNANYLKLLADNKTASSQVIALCVDQAGNVGVGCDTNEEYKLRVYGTGYFSSNLIIGGGLTYYSQRSLKNVIDERGLSLAELSAIKPTRYTWKDKRDNRIHIGGIADDVMTVLPEVVYKTADETLTMDYGNAGFAVASSLIKPVVDHEKRIIDHDERIKVLERENKELKERLNRYEA